MDMRVTIAGKIYSVDLNRLHSIAIPLRFDGPQPSFFGADRASARPLEAGGFVGDTRCGGSCNVAALHLVPHCNGTHTETVGHIVHSGPATYEALPQSLLPAVVASVTPVSARGTEDACTPRATPDDRVITREALSSAIGGYVAEEVTALVLRTLPNDPAKRTAAYGEAVGAAFLTADAAAYLVAQGVRHLIVDIPSIDRMHDDGRLANHHIFWNVREGSREPSESMWRDRTVTEMAYIEDHVEDGRYLLNLQLPAWCTDATPSRPVLYPLT